MNLDPGVVNLPYSPDVDIRETIDLQELMTKYSLGPNGALILAADMVATGLGKIQDEVDDLNAEYVIVDTPGQMELFAYRESGEYIVKQMNADSKVLLVLLDPLLANTPVNFLSLALLSASVGLRMKVPKISVMTKRDVETERSKTIIQWSRDAAVFEEALSKTREAEEYSLYSELFRSVRKLAFGVDLYPVSSVTLEGMVALVGEITRLARSGEEFTD